MNIAIACLSLIAGLGVLLLSMNLMTQNIETLAGNKLKKMFNKLGKSKLAGVGIGTATTAIIQSSGAVTVMVIGFVNASLMSLTQATTIIFGANIGTTVTAQIVALGMLGTSSISMNVIFGTLAGIGAFIMLFTKNETVKKVGGLIAGFGMLFVGLSLMSDSMTVFTESEKLINFLATLQNPILLVIIGCLVTALIQSSSTMTSIIITMLYGGLITIDQGVYMALGSNIGTCIVALIACIGTTTNAKRAAFIHFFFNVVGVVIFMFIGLFMRLGGTSFGKLLEIMFPGVPTTQLAMMHTIFNVITVILILPFTNLLVKMTEKLIKEKPKDKNGPKLTYLEEHILQSPPIAVEQVKKEILDMASDSIENFNLALDSVLSRNVDAKKTFAKREDFINFRNKEIIKFVVELTSLEISESDRTYLGTVHHTVTDIERIGDYSENIFEYAEKLSENEYSFSDEAWSELTELKTKINELYNLTMSMYVDSDAERIDKAKVLEDETDEITKKMSNNHIRRMSEKKCTVEAGALYLSLASDAERIGDHLLNIAESVEKFSKKTKIIYRIPKQDDDDKDIVIKKTL